MPAYDILKLIFLYENWCSSIMILLKFVPKSPIESNSAFDQIMAWRRICDKPLFEPIIA